MSDTTPSLDQLIARVPQVSGRVGLFGIGHEVYWSQFPGLRERLEANTKILASRLESRHIELVMGDLIVDNVSAAARVGDYFRERGVDLVICYLATYATSSLVLPIAQRAGAGMVVAGLQPSPGMDCRTSTTVDQLFHDNVTSLPEICGALIRGGRPPLGVIVGQLHGDARVERELTDWCRVAMLLRSLRDARIGYLGHTYEGMLDMHSDPTMLHAFFGLHVKMLEMCDLHACLERVTSDEVTTMMQAMRQLFKFADPGVDPLTGPVQPEELEWSARVAAALYRLVEEHDLTAMAYYYRGLGGNVYERLAAGMILGNSLLTGRGIPMAGEADLKTCLAMLIMDRLDMGGSFAEFHPVDFEDDAVLIGHDGPAHIRISEGQPVVRDLSVYHGKRGRGLSVEFKVRTGPVTLLGLTQTFDGRVKFVAATGESVAGETPRSGNTNTRARFPMPVAEFIERWSLEGPTHHFALGIGDGIPVLRKLAKALDVELAVVE